MEYYFGRMHRKLFEEEILVDILTFHMTTKRRVGVGQSKHREKSRAHDWGSGDPSEASQDSYCSAAGGSKFCISERSALLGEVTEGLDGDWSSFNRFTRLEEKRERTILSDSRTYVQQLELLHKNGKEQQENGVSSNRAALCGGASVAAVESSKGGVG